MTMRVMLIIAVLILQFSDNILSQDKKSDSRPNIIFIYTDDQREDALGVNGNKVIQTPQIDKLTKYGVKFTNANVAFALCSPSRAAFLTGRYGSANGVLELGSKLNKDEVSLAEYLNEAGYNTAVSGKWHLGQHPNKLGFDFYSIFHSNGSYYRRSIDDMGTKVKPEIHCDEYCVDRSIDFIKSTAKSGKPFFLYHNTQLPHMNGVLKWDAKQKTLEQYKQKDMPVAQNHLDNLEGKPTYLKNVRNLKQGRKYGYPDKESIQKHTKEYYAVITEMDDALGRLFQTIDELGLRKNTYIFFMSDNGWMLGDHGFTSKVLPYKPSSHVPFFVLGPDLKPGKLEYLVSNIDMAPTILDLAGIQVPVNMHGKSIMPLLNHKKCNWRTEFIYEGLGNYGGAKPNLTVITDRYRYIETYEQNQLDSIIYRELYNQKKDPLEINNLIGSQKSEKMIKSMKSAIAEHKKKILNL